MGDKSAIEWSSLPFPRIGDESWQREAVLWLTSVLGRDRRGSRLFGIVRSSPTAVAYLRQAPVLAACDSPRLAKAIARGGKLKAVMAEVGFAYPLRKISAGAVKESHAALYRSLSRLHPSMLAQALPDAPQLHSEWLRQIQAWRDKMTARAITPDRLIEWAAVHAIDAIQRAHPLDDIADYAANPDARFEVNWTFDRAVRAASAWHGELARLGSAARLYADLGVSFDQPVDYGDLPLSEMVDGFHVVALRSGAELHEDGRRMRHCVASYAADVVRGRCRIYSIRSAATPLATMEICHAAPPRRQRSSRKWTVWQIKGPCNTAPEARLVAAANLFLDIVNDGVV